MNNIIRLHNNKEVLENNKDLLVPVLVEYEKFEEERIEEKSGISSLIDYLYSKSYLIDDSLLESMSRIFDFQLDLESLDESFSSFETLIYNTRADYEHFFTDSMHISRALEKHLYLVNTDLSLYEDDNDFI